MKYKRFRKWLYSVEEPEQFFKMPAESVEEGVNGNEEERSELYEVYLDKVRLAKD